MSKVTNKQRGEEMIARREFNEYWAARVSIGNKVRVRGTVVGKAPGGLLRIVIEGVSYSSLQHDGSDATRGTLVEACEVE